MLGALIAFQPPRGMSAAERARFSHRFWGRDTNSWEGRYRYRRKGLMDGVPHVKLARAVVLVKLRDADRVTAFLEEAGASVQVRRAQLEPEDLRELGIA